MDSLGPPTFPKPSLSLQLKGVGITKSLRNSNPSAKITKDMLDVEDALDKLHKTINNFQTNPGAMSQASQVKTLIINGLYFKIKNHVLSL